MREQATKARQAACQLFAYSNNPSKSASLLPAACGEPARRGALAPAPTRRRAPSKTRIPIRAGGRTSPSARVRSLPARAARTPGGRVVALLEPEGYGLVRWGMFD